MTECLTYSLTDSFSPSLPQDWLIAMLRETLHTSKKGETAHSLTYLWFTTHQPGLSLQSHCTHTALPYSYMYRYPQARIAIHWPLIHTALTLHSHCTHTDTTLTLHSHYTHTTLTLNSTKAKTLIPCTHNTLTLHWHCTHTTLTLHSHYTDTALIPHSAQARTLMLQQLSAG